MQSSTDLQRRLASRGTHVSKPTAERNQRCRVYTIKTSLLTWFASQIKKKKEYNSVRTYTRQQLWQHYLDRWMYHTAARQQSCYLQTHWWHDPHHSKTKTPIKDPCMGWYQRRWPTQITLFDGILRKEFFVDNIIKGNLLPFIQTTFPDSRRFQQDNDPKHKSKLAQAFMTRNSINWWKEWPSESCDLNPIEMVWNQLKRYLAKKEPTTKDALVQHTMNFWYT